MRMDTAQEKYGRPLWLIGHKLTAIETTGTYALADAEITPGVPGPPPHHHAETDELFYVLDGEMEVLQGDTWHTVRRGEKVLIPKGTLHTFRGVDDQPARFVAIHDPGAKMDALLLGLGIPVEEPDSFERSVSEETIGAFAQVAADHDMHIAERPEPA